MKIDVRGLKKIKSDDKSTTFRTAKGHHFIVAHKAVAPDLRKQMEAIPHYDDGGEIESNEPWYKRTFNAIDNALALPDERKQATKAKAVASLEKEADNGERMPYSGPSSPPPEEPAEAPEAQPDRPNGFTRKGPLLSADQQASMDAIKEQEGPVSGDDNPERSPGSTPGGTQAVEQQENFAPAEQKEPPTAAIQDVGNPQQATQDMQAGKNYQKGFSDYYRENAQSLGHEDAAWQHDLQNGHISRETYHDLFAKKDTLGKVSMLFGLALGGIGSADTKMPNAYLAAMDKQIQGDYDAMSTSKSNAQNYLKIHQQQALNDIEIAKGKAGIPLTEAQAAAERATADTLGQAAFQMKQNRASIAEITQMVQKIPQGTPQRAAADKMLYLTMQAVDAKNMNISDVAASRAALISAMGGSGAGGEQGFQNNQRFAIGSGDPALQKIAELNQQTHIPNVGQASAPVPQSKKDELQALKTLEDKVKDVMNYAKANKGTMNYAKRRVGEQKADELVNFYNQGLNSGGLTAGRLHWLDAQLKNRNPTSAFQDILGQNDKFGEILRSTQQREKILLQGLGAEEPAQSASPTPPAAKAASGGMEGKTATNKKTGEQLIFRNGSWKPYGGK